MNIAKNGEFWQEDLKTGSGKAFAYKRFVPVALKNDFSYGRRSFEHSTEKPVCLPAGRQGSGNEGGIKAGELYLKTKSRRMI